MSELLLEIRVALNHARRAWADTSAGERARWCVVAASLETSERLALEAQIAAAEREAKLAGAVTYYRTDRDLLDEQLAARGRIH